MLEQVENKNDISSGEVSSVDAGQIAGRYAESHGSRPPSSPQPGGPKLGCKSALSTMPRDLHVASPDALTC